MEFDEARPKVFFCIHKKLISCLSCLLSKNSKNVVILHDYDIILKKASRLDNFLLTIKFEPCWEAPPNLIAIDQVCRISEEISGRNTRTRAIIGGAPLPFPFFINQISHTSNFSGRLKQYYIAFCFQG